MFDLKNRDNLITHLTFYQGLMQSSERLLWHAACKTPEDNLEAYYRRHLDEESHHAIWLANDLRENGIEPPVIHWQAAMLAGVQYYLIEHVSHWALLGYMAVLEGFPMETTLLEELEAIHGKSLLRTVRYHAEHDIVHGPDVMAIVKTAPDREVDLIAQNAKQTAAYLQGVFQ